MSSARIRGRLSTHLPSRSLEAVDLSRNRSSHLNKHLESAGCGNSRQSCPDLIRPCDGLFVCDIFEKNGVPDGTDYNKERSVGPLMEFSRAKLGGDDRTLRK